MQSANYMFIAGDPSGDEHAARVIKNLLHDNPICQCIGIGGPAMQAEGFISLLPFEPFNRMGFLEVIPQLPYLFHAQKTLISYLRCHMPKCLICVDYSGFNIPMIKVASKIGIPVVWYIAPMVWAWKKKRAKTLAKFATHICCIFPFEIPYFTPFTNRVSFVGNPLIEKLTAENHLPSPRQRLPDKPTLAIIPGSRRQEIVHMLHPMIGAYKLLRKIHPSLRAVVSQYRMQLGAFFSHAVLGTDIQLHTGSLEELLLRTDIALVTSGTATLETTLMGIPHVIAYKTSPITYTIFRHFITLSHIGLPNIIAGETVVPECIQEHVTEKELAERVNRFLSNEFLYVKTAERLLQVSDFLGSEKPSKAVAEVILKCSRK